MRYEAIANQVYDRENDHVMCSFSEGRLGNRLAEKCAASLNRQEREHAEIDRLMRGNTGVL